MTETAPADPHPANLFTIPETAARLRISKTTLYRMMRTGQITPLRINGRTLFSGLEIARFLGSIAEKQTPLGTNAESYSVIDPTTGEVVENLCSMERAREVLKCYPLGYIQYNLILGR